MSVLSFGEFKKQRKAENTAAQTTQQPQTSSTSSVPTPPGVMSYEEFKAARGANQTVPQSTGSVNHETIPSVPETQPISFQQRMAMQSYEQSKTTSPTAALVDVSTPKDEKRYDQPKTDYTSEETQKKKAALKAKRDAIASRYNALNDQKLHGMVRQQDLMAVNKELAEMKTQIDGYNAQIAELEKPLTFGEQVKSAGTHVYSGLERAGLGVTKALDWALGEKSLPWAAANEVATMVTGKESPLTGLNPISALAQKGENEVAYWQNKAAEMAEGNTIAENIGKHAASVAQSAPFIVMNLMTMGGAGAAAAGATSADLAYTAAINSSPAAQMISTMATRSLETLAANPVAQYSFMSTFGSSYEDALNDGATEAEATIYAMLNAGFGTIVEMGGGLEALPAQVQEALNTGNRSIVLDYAKSVSGEIGEEEVQGILERGLKSGYQETELYSNENPDAIINPSVMAETAKDTAIDTAIMGGAQTAVQAGINALANAASKSIAGRNVAGQREIASEANEETANPLLDNSTTRSAEAQKTAQRTQPTIGQKPVVETESADDFAAANFAPQSTESAGGTDTLANAQENAEAPSGEFNSKGESGPRSGPAEKPVGSWEGAKNIEGIESLRNTPSRKLESEAYRKANEPAKKTSAADTAKKLKETTGTNRSTSDIERAVQDIADYIASNGNGEGVNTDTVREMAESAAASILDNVPGEAQDSGLYDALKSFLRGRDIQISDELRGDVADYNQWRKSIFGKLDLRAKSGTAIDSLYQELASSFGEGLFPSNITSHSEQIEQILHVLESNRPQTQMWSDQVSESDYNTAVNEVANQIIRAAENMESDKTALDEENLASLEENAPPETIERADRSKAEATGPERERGFTKNVRTDKDRAASLREVLNKNKGVYRQLTNSATLEKALEIAERETQNGRDFVSYVEDQLTKAENGSKLAPEMVPLTKMAADYLSHIGDAQAAAELTARMAVQMTEAGQFTQAAKILRRAPADTVMRTINKALERVNEQVREKFGPRQEWRAKLTAEEKAMIESADYSEDGAFERVYEQIAKRVGAEMPVTFWEKLTELRRVNMLLRPRTHIRNVLANVPTVPMRIMKDRLSGAIQDALVKSGKLDKAEQTRTGKVGKKSREVAQSWYADHKGEIQSMGEKWDATRTMREYKRYFKDGPLAKALSKMTGMELHNALETARRATYKALEAGDAPFVRMAYIDALAQICEARGVTSAEGITPEMHEFALANAAEATYKAETVTANLLNRLKREAPGVGKVVDILMPFTNTPANILKMTTEYSPVGFAKAINNAMRGDSVTTTVDLASKATVGTAIIGLGMLLRSMGRITGDDDDDKNVAAWEKATGKSARSVGGRYAYDWAQPTGSMIALGAGIWDALQGNDDAASAVMDALYSAGDGILEMSLFQNIKSVLSGYGSTFEKSTNAVIEGLASQMVPGIVSDIAKILDPTVRSTYTEKSVFSKVLNRAKANIPGLSKTLPASVDVRGESVTRGTVTERIIDALLNPGSVNRNKANDVDAEIRSVYDETGKAAVIPKVADKTVEFGGSTYTLTAKEREAFQQTMGKAYYDAIKSALGDRSYKDLGADEKAALMEKARTYALREAKVEFAEGRGLDESAVDRDKWERLPTGQRALYLVAKARANTLYDKGGRITDYKGMDYFLKSGGAYSGLSSDAREILGNGSHLSRLDNMFEAAQNGIGSKQYDMAYQKWKQLNEQSDKTAAAEDMKTYIDSMSGLTRKQKDWLTDDLGLYRVMRVDTDTRDKFTGAGVKSENADKLARSFRSIEPAQGYAGVQDSQRYQAIASASYLSDAEKWEAFFALVANDNKAKCRAEAEHAKENGYSFDEWAAKSDYAKVKTK